MLHRGAKGSFKSVARIFQRGRGGSHCVKQRLLIRFRHLNIVGCCLERLIKGGEGFKGTTGSPQATPLKLEPIAALKKIQGQ